MKIAPLPHLVNMSGNHTITDSGLRNSPMRLIVPKTKVYSNHVMSNGFYSPSCHASVTLQNACANRSTVTMEFMTLNLVGSRDILAIIELI